MEDRLNEYKEYNPAIEYALIHNTKQLPQLEKPAEVLKKSRLIFHSMFHVKHMRLGC